MSKTRAIVLLVALFVGGSLIFIGAHQEPRPSLAPVVSSDALHIGPGIAPPASQPALDAILANDSGQLSVGPHAAYVPVNPLQVMAGR